MNAGVQLTFSFSIYDLRPGDATYIQVESSSPSLPLEASAYTHLEVCYYGDSKSGQIINEDEPS